MMWVDYTIDSLPGGNGFTVKGDWEGEVMGWDRHGKPGAKDNTLYQPGDIFRVNERGWLIKIGEDKDDI